jgi:hypothetical protein
MPGALAIALPLTLAGVLIVSAITKFRTADDLAGWAEIGVPAGLRKEWLRRLHPWGELALGVVIAAFGGMLGLLAALVAVALMTGYTWLVARAVLRKDDASCACFGARKRVTKVTVIRNVWLTALAVATAALSWTTPLIGGPLRAGVTEGGWVIGLVVAAATTALILWPEGGQEVTAGPPHAAVADSDDERDYVRMRTPAVPVTLADGSVENLRTMAARKPILILSVSATCAPCAPVIEKIGAWRNLLPEVDVRFLVATSPETSSLIESTQPQSLHDLDGYVRQSLDMSSTPTAVLLGVDGLLAGGPVGGAGDIEAFVDDIYESLHGQEQPAVSTMPDQRG